MIEDRDENSTIIRLNATVYCCDEYCGVIQNLIIDPMSQILTWLVVKPANLPAITRWVERLVPLSQVSRAADDGLWLKCNVGEFSGLCPFTETFFTQISAPETGSLDNGTVALQNNTVHVPAIKYNKLPGETVIGRQVQIEAKNGHLGQFEGFVVQSATGEITDLVFQWGHLWDRRRETVPATLIENIEGDAIYLTINRSDLTRK